MKTVPTVGLTGGSKLPWVGLGTWQMHGSQAVEAITTALELGYRHLDTAKIYGNEAEVAEAVAASGVARQDIFITTKLMPLPGDEVETAIGERLRLLNTDYLDLLLIHWPPHSGVAADMWQSMAAQQRAGVLKNIGVSNYSADQLAELVRQTGITPAVNQIELSPFNAQVDTRAFCKQHQIVIEAYSPLTRQRQLSHPLLAKLADKYDRSPAQIMLRWCVQSDTVPLPKASSRIHLEENLAIFDFSISDEDMQALGGLDAGLSVLH